MGICYYASKCCGFVVDHFPLTFALGGRFISYIDEDTIDLVQSYIRVCIYIQPHNVRSNVSPCETHTKCHTILLLHTVCAMNPHTAVVSVYQAQST